MAKKKRQLDLFEEERLWHRLPEQTQSLCQELLGRLLLAVLKEDGRKEETNEREDLVEAP